MDPNYWMFPLPFGTTVEKKKKKTMAKVHNPSRPASVETIKTMIELKGVENLAQGVLDTRKKSVRCFIIMQQRYVTKEKKPSARHMKISKNLFRFI